MWDPWRSARASEDLRGRLKWFLLGRLAVISCFLGVVGALLLHSGEDGYVVPVQHLLLFIAATYAFSMVSALVLPRTTHLRGFAHIQIAFDVLLITGVIFLTGGLDSPFPFLYSLPIINSAGLLIDRGVLTSALCAALAYDGLIAALATGLISSISFPLPAPVFDLSAGLRVASTNLTFFLIAYLAGILTRRIHEMERLILERQAERDHLALLQETLARTIGSGLLTTDPEGHVMSADTTIERLAGRSDTQLRGCDIGTIFPPLRLTPSARLRFTQSTTALAPVEFSHEDAGGAALHIRCVAAPLKDTYGHPIGALYVLQDVTRLKELEQQAPVSDLEDLYREDLEFAAELAEATDGLHGTSPAIRRVRELIDRVANSDTTVLIEGESGTGKELVARAIHAHSPRRDKPLVTINCGAIPEHLIESELFGHVRGSFTGAVADRAGCFRMADSGSLFLDEIGELPLHLQVKLLRVLQERVLRPVGGETSVAVDVRIIAASNRDLTAEVKAGRFREDLFYRLNVISVRVPPLRERREDIPLLIRHFLRQFSELHGRRVCRFAVSAGKRLLQYDYPGNIRELENVVEHAVTLCDGETATEEHLPAYLLRNGSRHSANPPSLTATAWSAPPPPPAEPDGTFDLDRDLAEYEKTVLLRALNQAGGVKKRAAELLGINYRSLRHRLQKYGLCEPGDLVAAETD